MAGEDSLKQKAEQLLGLQVAGLGFWLHAPQGSFLMVAPPAHEKFLHPSTSQPLQAYLGRENQGRTGNTDLYLQVKEIPLDSATGWGTLICRTKIWELWQNSDNQYVFTTPLGKPPLQLTVCAGFKKGEVCGNFSLIGGKPTYPLLGIDNVLFVNWLASLGDIMLHASGVVLDGKGYAFIGPSKAGKSTLAAALARDHNALVLGEDQLVLRWLDGRFWIFGSPWHLDPARCSPNGAPLEKLFFLDRSLPLGMSKLSPGSAVSRILQTAFIPYYRPDLMPGILERLSQLPAKIPISSLNYRLGSDCWHQICNT